MAANCALALSVARPEATTPARRRQYSHSPVRIAGRSGIPPFDASRCWLVPDSHAFFDARFWCRELKRFVRIARRLSDGRQNGLKGSALKEGILRLFDSAMLRTG